MSVLPLMKISDDAQVAIGYLPALVNQKCALLINTLICIVISRYSVIFIIGMGDKLKNVRMA